MRTLGTALLIAGLAANTVGAETERIGVFQDWAAYRLAANGAAECFAFSVPFETRGAPEGRGDALVQVTHRPAEGVRSEISFTLGHTPLLGEAVRVVIDGRRFELFAHEDRAYAQDAEADSRLVQAMRRGHTLELRSVAASGRTVTDKYSLTGFTAAHGEIGGACP